MLRTKLSFEQQESKFKQDRLTIQLKDLEDQLGQAKKTLDKLSIPNAETYCAVQQKLQHISEL